MTRKFNDYFIEAIGDYGVGNLAVAVDKLEPEVGDIVQLQVTGNLSPWVTDEKTNSFNTYRIKDLSGDKATLELSDMITGTQVKTFKNPTGDLDSTYTNGTPIEELPNEITLNLKKLQENPENVFNYMHDNIWSFCLVDREDGAIMVPQIEDPSVND